MMSIYNPQHDELNKKSIALLSGALAIDAKILPALLDRALAYTHLKKWPEAIADYDRVLALDPKNFTAYNDRGLAKFEIGKTYDGISDFGAAIRNNAGLDAVDSLDFGKNSAPYEGRADGYRRTRQWELAIRDLTTAISLHVGGAVLLWNIDQFRDIYPEYQAATNEAIARKLNETFYPILKYEHFSGEFFTRRGVVSFVIGDLYLKRSDAYLAAGNWRRASIEFRRAINVPNYADAIDRWRAINHTIDGTTYIDMKTFDDARRDAIKIWIKQARPQQQTAGSAMVVQDDAGPFSLQQFELNCSTRQIRAASYANYDATGNLIGSREGGRWENIIPETLGETLYNGACGNS